MKRRIFGSTILLLAASHLLAADQPKPDAAGPGCNLNPLHMASPDDYYPAKERRAGHAGRVVVQYSIDESTGKLVDIVVTEPSPYPALDAAAVRVMEHTRFKTNCPGKRWTIAVQFGPRPPAAPQ